MVTAASQAFVELCNENNFASICQSPYHGMTVGTYELKGGDNRESYNVNKATLLSAFGSTNCTDYSSGMGCRVSGLRASASDDGGVHAHDSASANCDVYDDGSSYCGGGE